jgi:mono/diheme cytochrome c family protein
MMLQRLSLAGAALVLLFALVHPAPSPAHPQAAADGAALFAARCGYCHLPGGTGTMMLERRLGKDHALLAERSNLQAAYVRTVVRNGLNSMPALTRVEVPDEQLDAIADYLAKPTGKGQ